MSVKRRQEATEEEKHSIKEGRSYNRRPKGTREEEEEREAARGPQRKKSPKEDAAYTHNAAAEAGRRSV